MQPLTVRFVNIIAASLAPVLGSATCMPVLAKGGGGHGSHAHTSSAHGTHGSHAHSDGGHGGHARTPGVQRDHDGRIHRSTAAKDDFKRRHPCPSTGKSSGACPGYVIDHVVPLKRGGADAPSNMQWQSTAEARAKDKTE